MTFSQLCEEPNYKLSAECPCLGRNEKNIILIHVDDLTFIFLPKIQGKIDTSVSKIERIGDEFNFPRRQYKLEVDGPWIQPGNYTQQMLKAYEDQIGLVKLQQLPADDSIQMEDKSEVCRSKRRLAFSEAILGQVSTYVKRGI